jgi:phosphohistidine phosphatase SixA
MTVILMRHAAYEFSESLRVRLTERGEKQADSIGGQLAESGIIPDRIWHSNLEQAEQTALRLVAVFNNKSHGKVPLETKDWLFDKGKLLEPLPEGETVLIIAHQDNFRFLAANLGAEWGDIPRPDRCATLVFEENGSSVRTVDQIQPKLDL